MTLIREQDFGTPAKPGPATVHVQVDGRDVEVPEGTSIMRAAATAGVDVPKLCATDSLGAFGSCRLCLVEVDGRRGTPASCTTPCSDGMSVKTRSREAGPAAQRGHGAVLQRPPPGLPDREQPGVVRAARHGRRRWYDRRPLRPAGDEPPGRGQGHQQPVLRVRPGEVHRLFALRARVRRGPGHVRADDRRPGLRLARLRRPGRTLPRVRVRQLRGVRPGLSDRRAAGEDPHPARTTEPERPDDVRLLRRRLLVQGRDAGRHGREHGPVQERRRERGPLVRQGSLRVGLRQPPGPGPQAAGPRHDRGSVARGRAGTRPSPTRPGASREIAPQYGASAIGGITSSRCTNEEVYLVQKMVRAAFGTNNVDTCARVCHSPTGYGLKTTFGTSAGTQDFASVEKADVIMVIGANPTDGHPVFASRMKRRLRARRQAHRGRPAPDRSRAQPAHRGEPPPPAPAGHQRRGDQRDGARRRDRGTDGPGVRRRALRGRLRVGRVHRPPREQPRGHGADHRRPGRRAARRRTAVRDRPERGHLLRSRRHRAQPGLDDGHGHGQPRDGHRQHRA